ncbi:MAG: DUF6765 family protein [Halanaerobiaceae bacterium]
MQIDFHHTAIYVLCRLAGMKSIYAEKTAYASQQVDDAVHGHALSFKNGGVFQQSRTSHHGLSRKLVDISDAFNIWIPFHFLPSGEGETISEKLVTRPESKVLELLKEDIIKSGSESHGLHLLGIGLHLYADAYSHQDFKGFFNDFNDIDLLSGIEKKNILKRLLDYLMKFFSFLAPVGHGQALKNPDIPYAVWSYSRGDGEIIEVDNLKERFSPAIDSIYSFLIDFLEANPEYKIDGKIKTYREFNVFKDKMLALLKKEGDPFERHGNWLDAIHSNDFSFKDFDNVDRSLCYDKRAWFNTAVQAMKQRSWRERLKNSYANYYTFNCRETFADSDWVKYMRAAAIHKYRLLHVILPECGLDLG